MLVALFTRLKCFVLTRRVYNGRFGFIWGAFYHEWVTVLLSHLRSQLFRPTGTGRTWIVKMQHSETCPNLTDKSRINYSARLSSLWVLFIWRLYYSLVLGNNRFRRSGNELGSSQVCNRACWKLPYRWFNFIVVVCHCCVPGAWANKVALCNCNFVSLFIIQN